MVPKTSEMTTPDSGASDKRNVSSRSILANHFAHGAVSHGEGSEDRRDPSGESMRCADGHRDYTRTRMRGDRLARATSFCTAQSQMHEAS